MKPVEIVQINQLIPIFKNGEKAERIEVARVKTSDGTELQFNIIVGKGLYKVNDFVIYIMPDYCLPDNELFTEYWQPGGDKSKCKLGKKGRIRALKFNFQFDNSSDPIYSNGIILPIVEVAKYLNQPIIIAVQGSTEIDQDLQKDLSITKYVAEDSFENQKSGLTKGDLPSFLYPTDETRIELLKDHVDKCYNENEVLGFTRKRDGSSATTYSRINPVENEQQVGVCTRNQEKKLEQQYTSLYKDLNSGVLLRPHFNKELNIKGWFNEATETFYTNEDVLDITKYEPIVTEVRDSWVDTVKKHKYLDKLVDYCNKYNIQLALRGELIGAGNKGSGNKLNSDAKTSESKIVWFGVDDLSSGHAVRIHYGQEHNLKKVCDELEMEYTEELFDGVYSYDEIIKLCTDYFNKVKRETGIIVEGIVIRSKYSNKLSTKFINPDYDSKS